MLILLLAVSLAPLIIVTASHYITTLQLMNRLASDTHEILTESAHGFLLNLVNDYGRILNRDKELLEVMLNMQAREITRSLSQSPPPSPKVIYSDEYDKGLIPAGGMIQSSKHYYLDPFGKRTPIPVTYNEQAYLLVKGTNRDTVTHDMARLSTMPDFFQMIFRIKPKLILWQYVGLESGMLITYPGAGGFPPNFDPRKRDWYTMAQDAGQLVWGPPVVDAQTRITVLTLSKPVFYPDASFAGVTAIDVRLPGIFQELKLPARWASLAKITLVTPEFKAEQSGYKLAVAAQMEYLNLRQDWQTPVALEYLESDKPEQTAALIKEALNGSFGVQKMGFMGKESLWAFGPKGPGNTFPVVILPYEAITSQAAETEALVLEVTRKELIFTGLIFGFVLFMVACLAFIVSGRITGPIIQLSDAATKLTHGDYRSKVNISTGDELQDLGEIFNRMGNELKLHQHQLLQADKMASLGVLVAGMAHEINNPNSLILLNICQLQRAWTDISPILEEHFLLHGDFQMGGLNYSEIGDEMPEILEDTRDRAERIKRIVHDLKNFSQHDQRPRTQSIDLNEVAEVAVRLVNSSIKRSTTHFSIFLADSLPRFNGTARRIEQIVINLLLNACQALEDDGQQITLTTGFLEKTGEVILDVENEGQGIPPDQLPKLTDPFYTTRREQGGTGLGLFISAGIAAEHGGCIEFTSNPGRGTRARLRLPKEA